MFLFNSEIKCQLWNELIPINLSNLISENWWNCIMPVYILFYIIKYNDYFTGCCILSMYLWVCFCLSKNESSSDQKLNTILQQLKKLKSADFPSPILVLLLHDKTPQTVA